MIMEAENPQHPKRDWWYRARIIGLWSFLAWLITVTILGVLADVDRKNRDNAQTERSMEFDRAARKEANEQREILISFQAEAKVQRKILIDSHLFLRKQIDSGHKAIDKELATIRKDLKLTRQELRLLKGKP